jgi:hypothetical protein
LGAALILPLTASGENLVEPPSPTAIPDAASAVPATPDATNAPEKPSNDRPPEFVGPPLPPPAPDAKNTPETPSNDRPPVFVGPPLPPPVPDAKNVLDKPRNYMSAEFVDFVSYIDRFFGYQRNYQEANDSVMHIDITRVMGYTGENKFVVSASADVKLPMAEQKLHLIVETDPDRNATVDPKRTQSPPLSQPSTPQSYAAALRIEKVQSERWHLSADAGIKLAGLNSSPFVRTQANLAVPMEQWNVRLSETVFWFNSTGAGETSQLELERPISTPVLFRATSVAAWLDRTQYFDLRQDLTLFHKLDERNTLMYQASAIGVTQPHTEVDEYVVLMLYRHRLHRKWMFLEVSPQLHFPRTLNFQINAMLSLQLQMLFDESK